MRGETESVNHINRRKYAAKAVIFLAISPN